MGRRSFTLRKKTVCQVIQLNHEAAKRSYDLHAFFPATTYLETAVSLLDPFSWENQYELSLELHTFLAQMYLASGQLRRIPRVVRQVKNRSRCFRDRLSVEIVAINCCKMNGEIEEHIQRSIVVLKILGLKLNLRYFRWQTDNKVKELKENIDSMPDSDLYRKSIIEGTGDRTALIIGERLVHTLLHNGCGKLDHTKKYTNLAMVVVCEMVEAFAMEKIQPDFSPVCLAYAACLFSQKSLDSWARLSMKLNCKNSETESDMALSIRLTELALRLPNSQSDPHMIASVGLIRHWRYPLTSCIKIALAGYNYGMKR